MRTKLHAIWAILRDRTVIYNAHIIGKVASAPNGGVISRCEFTEA